MPKEGSLVNATRGLTAQDYYTRNMVPVRGAPQQGATAVPAGSHAMVPESTEKIGCQMPKRDGSACRMAPLKGNLFCVTHSKQVAKEVGAP